MPPQKIFKIQGVSGAFWCDFGTYELKHQLTSAHTQTLRVRVATASQNERAPLLEPHLPRRKCTYAKGDTYTRTAVARVSSFKRQLIQGGAAPVLQVLGGLQPPQPPPPLPTPVTQTRETTTVTLAHARRGLIMYMVPFARCNAFKYSFFCTVICLWNCLSHEAHLYKWKKSFP